MVADVRVTLGAVAARTSRVRLGPLVTSLGRRRPWKVALEASTLQRLSGVEVEHRGSVFALVEVSIWVGGAWPRSVPFRAAEHAAGVVPATLGPEGLVVLSPADAERLKADFVASGGSEGGDVVLRGGPVLPVEVAEYEAAGVTWMVTDGGARVWEELRALVAAGPPRSDA